MVLNGHMAGKILELLMNADAANYSALAKEFRRTWTIGQAMELAELAGEL